MTRIFKVLRNLIAVCYVSIMPVLGQCQPVQPVDSVATVTSSGMVEHTFALKNDSDENLQIIAHKTTCSCLQVTKLPELIPPHSTADIVVRFDPQNARGRVSQMAILETSDKQHKYRRFVLNTTIPSLWLEPVELNLGVIDRSQVVSGEILVLQAGLENVHAKVADLTQVDVTIKKMKQLKELPKGDAFSVIQVTANGSKFSPGEHNVRLCVETDQKAFQKVFANVKLFVRGRADVRPTKVLFGRVTSEKMSVRTCQVTLANADGNCRLSDLRLEDEKHLVKASLSGEIKSINGSETVSLEAKITAPNVSKPELVNGVIVGRIKNDIVFTLPYYLYAIPADVNN